MNRTCVCEWMVCRCENSKPGIREKDFCFDIDLGSSLQLKSWDTWGYWMGYHSQKNKCQKRKKKPWRHASLSVGRTSLWNLMLWVFTDDHRRREGDRKRMFNEQTILWGARPGLRSCWLVWTPGYLMKHLLSSSLFHPLTLLPHQGAED